MKAILALSLAAALFLASTATADTIYTWTDDQGVQRFSNTPPPEGVKNFKTLESEKESPKDAGAEEQRRSSYDQMVQEASQEADQLIRQRQAEAAARAEEEKRKAEAMRKEKIQSERSRLERQIKDIQNRALGPTYTQGMKNAQIQKIQKQIDALENNGGSAETQESQKRPENNSGY